jgi:hypothetical protein
MSIGKQGEYQGTMWVAYDQLRKGHGTPIYSAGSLFPDAVRRLL